MSKRCILETISLAPYDDNNPLLLVCGASYEETLLFAKENFSCYNGATDLKIIKRRSIARSEFFEFLKDFEKTLNEFHTEENKETYRNGSCITDAVKGYYLIILSSDFSTTNTENLITLAHEVLHLCQALLPHYLDRDEEQEAEAYFHSHIMRSICNAFNSAT